MAEIKEETDPSALDKLKVSWLDDMRSWGRDSWRHELILDRRGQDGVWQITNVEIRLHGSGPDSKDAKEAGVAMNFGEKTKLWFSPWHLSL